MGRAWPGPARPIRPMGRNFNGTHGPKFQRITHGLKWAEYRTKRKLSKLLSQ
ncbi:unnamed protein product, partial [Rotaria sp. Silwood2]